MSPTVITLIFLAFAIIMFVTEKIPLGLTSMIVCIGLVITGVLSVSDAFNGFINSNVILFVAMFIVGGALFETSFFLFFIMLKSDMALSFSFCKHSISHFQYIVHFIYLTSA